jgi:tetratricopeptide (TPR) repeat protein
MRRLSFTVPAGLLSAALLLTILPALSAPETAAAQSADARTRARALYTEGQRLFDAGDFAGALAKFEEAYGIVNNPVVLLGVASAQERLGRLPEARATLERYLRERPTAPDRADIEARIAAMPAAGTPTPPVATTGTVALSSDPRGATVVVDGESSGAVTPTELTLAPGDHEIALALSGYELSTQTVSVTAGERSDLSIPLTATPEAEPVAETTDEEEPAEETPAPSSDPSAATWVTTAIAGVALVTGTVFGFVALSRQSDFDVAPSRTLADEGEAFALAADLAFGVAIAAGITAIVLYATDRPSAPPAASEEGSEDEARATGPSFAVAPMVSPTGGGIAAGMSF